MEELMGLSILVTIFLFIIAILWIILPFAVFGIKPLLREILVELREMNGKVLDKNTLLKYQQPNKKIKLKKCPSCGAYQDETAIKCLSCSNDLSNVHAE